jgi:hypothetical protein
LGVEKLGVAARRPYADRPRACVVVELGGQDLRAEPDVLADAVAVGELPEVVQQDVLGGEVIGPVVVLEEGVVVQVAADVDAAARIGVLQPSAGE